MPLNKLLVLQASGAEFERKESSVPAINLVKLVNYIKV